MKPVPFSEDLYVISDSVDCLKKAVEDGAAIVQLRDKTGDRPIILKKARELIAHKRERSFIFILNDDPALALRQGLTASTSARIRPLRTPGESWALR